MVMKNATAIASLVAIAQAWTHAEVPNRRDQTNRSEDMLSGVRFDCDLNTGWEFKSNGDLELFIDIEMSIDDP